MKLIVDIDEEDYKAIKNMSVVGDMTIPYVFDSIRNGIPLDNLRAKIEQMDFDFGDYYDHTDSIRDMVLAVIDICTIKDKYNKESEEV